MTETKCPECGEVFDSKRAYTGHKTVHSQESPSEDQLLQELERLAEQCEGDLTTTYARKHCKYSVGLYQSRFGGWNQALNQCGLKTSVEVGVSDNQLINYLQSFANKSESTPTSDLMDEKGDFSASLYSSRFGSWNNAMTRAGLAPTQNRDLSKARMLCSLRDLGERLERTPTAVEITENGEYATNSYIRKFGSLKRAQRLAGFEPNRGRVIIDCSYCGTSVNKPKSRVESTLESFCSERCYDKHRSELDDGEHPLSKRETVDCDECGTELLVMEYKADQRRHFCGVECMGRFRKTQTGEDAHAWKQGSFERRYYGPNWERVRRRCRERDDYTCQGCAVEEEELGQELSIHHIIPFREFVPEDGEPDFEAANDLDNLVSLCQKCHGKYEGVPVRPQFSG